MNAQAIKTDLDARSIIADNICSRLREEPNRSLLLLSEPIDTNGGSYSAQQSWAALADALHQKGFFLVINQDGLWLSRDSEQLNDASTFLVLQEK